MKKKSMRSKVKDELDDLWREIIYMTYNFTCEICGKVMTPEECHAHHIIFRSNYNTRWDLANGSLLCDHNHNRALNAPHFDNKEYLEWLKVHRWRGHYEHLLRKSGEKGGTNKLTILELMQLRNRLKYIKESMEREKEREREQTYTTQSEL